METFFVESIVEHYIKTARHGDDDLMKILVRVGTAIGAARNVIGVVDPLDLERDVVTSLDEGEVASRVADLRKVEKFAVL